MADIQEQTGEGTLYDTDDNELATVAYKVEPQSPDGAEWGGQIFFAHEDTVVDAGLYVLSLEDGTQIDIDLAPAVDSEGREHAFKGVGTFGQRIM
ncbi:MAG TPA: hypothetical protein VH482_35435 [Thermomicrobiales bacterium]|jgi:hypothetical protein